MERDFPLPRRAALVLGLAAAACGSPRLVDAAEVSARSFEATARRAGMRVVAGRHLVLATDRPASPDDDLADWPAIFDQAFDAWCHHFDLDPAAHAQWQAVGCLIVEPERFRGCGLLPPTVPAFENGFCAGHRFWLMDQSNPAYRRHLLLHEGVHAFTITLRGLDTPSWYTEGIAELLATHRLVEGGFESTPIPRDAADVEQLGRIEAIRRLRDAGTAPSLAEVLATPASRHHRIPDYAASWAAVALLAGHPAHRVALARAERGPLDARFTARLEATPGFDMAAAARDFDAFTDDVDYGYDLEAMAVDWSPAAALTGAVVREVAADRGWQNTRASLMPGQGGRFEAAGRVQLGRRPGVDVDLESEADGITVDWYRGRPVGRLLVGQWVDEPAAGGRPRFVVLAEGARGTFEAVTDGPLYLRLNDPPAHRRDNAGSLRVTLHPWTR